MKTEAQQKRFAYDDVPPVTPDGPEYRHQRWFRGEGTAPTFSVYRNSGKNYAELTMGGGDAAVCTAWVTGKVGTTALRALESAARSGSLQAGQGDTDIFITPGYEFKVVDRLITNFHLPKSTLLMLVSALAGYDEIRAVYQHAIAEQYRFFSYGDAMILGNKAQSD